MMLRLAVAALGIVLSLSAVIFFASDDIQAADARNYNAGRIIDDAVFTNRDSMTVDDIQKFLSSKVKCDSWGVKKSELGGGTRAQWMSARGISAPFKCITDYREIPSTGQNNYGRDGALNGSLSAAEIIYNYSRQFNINPQVIIVTLQKENGLITDEWPTPKQYSEAMGFGCPDNVAPGAPACNPQYGSFSAQVYQAARHFRGYIDNLPGWWVPFTTGVNSIAWNPTSSCGRSDVNIENRATVALYSYTPYQPNQAARNAQYGNGDNCSAYGNRNFYLYFNDWFGSTYGDVSLVSDLRVSHDEKGHMYTGERTVSFVLRNDSSQTIDYGYVGVSSRSPSGRTYGFTMKRAVIGPRQTFTYTDTQSHFTEEGQHRFSVVALKDGVYREDIPASSNSAIVREWTVYIQRGPEVVGNVTLETQRPTAGSNVTISYKVRNNSLKPVAIGDMGLTLRHEDGTNVGMPMNPNVIIAANSEVVVRAEQKIPREGKYSAGVINTKNNGSSWDASFPASASQSVVRSVEFTSKPSVSLQKTPSIDGNTSVGGDVSVGFTIKNFTNQTRKDGSIGVAVRDSSGANVGFDMQEFIVPASGEFTYSVPSRSFTKPGRYTAWITHESGGNWSRYSAVEDDTISPEFTFDITQNMLLSEAPSFNIESIHANQPVRPDIKIENTSQGVVSGYPIGLAVRDDMGGNVGFDMTPLVIPSLSSFSYRPPEISFARPGKYTAWVTQLTDKGYSEYSSLGQGVSARVTYNVKPDATLQATPSLVPSQPRVGDMVNARFTIKNYSKYRATDYPLGLVVFDPQGRNVGFAMQDVSVPIGGEFTYNVPGRKFTVPGVYTAWIVQNVNGFWPEYNKVESESVSPRFKFTVSP